MVTKWLFFSFRIKRIKLGGKKKNRLHGLRVGNHFFFLSFKCSHLILYLFPPLSWTLRPSKEKTGKGLSFQWTGCVNQTAIFLPPLLHSACLPQLFSCNPPAKLNPAEKKGAHPPSVVCRFITRVLIVCDRLRSNCPWSSLAASSAWRECPRGNPWVCSESRSPLWPSEFACVQVEDHLRIQNLNPGHEFLCNELDPTLGYAFFLFCAYFYPDGSVPRCPT